MAGTVFESIGRPYESLNGGPGFVHVNTSVLAKAQKAGSTVGNQGYFLGVMHYHTKVAYEHDPTYHHHLIKVEPYPPFKIMEVSAELQLQHTMGAPSKPKVAFVSGLQLAMLHPRQADATNSNPDREVNGAIEASVPLPFVIISYGAADYSSRIMYLSLAEVDVLFSSGTRQNQSTSGRVEAAVTSSSEHVLLMSDAATLETAFQRRRAGALLVYWNAQHCGGDSMCENLHKANVRMPSCWSWVPASGSLKEKQQGCTCSGPKHLGFSSLLEDDVVGFASRYSWAKTIFAERGMPAKPYFGNKAVQVAVICHPMIRYLFHAHQSGQAHNILDFMQPNMTAGILSEAVMNHATNLKYIVPDNYLTRFYAGRTALEDYSLLSTSVTDEMYKSAINNLNRVDVVLVLEQSATADIAQLLKVLGLMPFDHSLLAKFSGSSLLSPSSLPPQLHAQLLSQHYHDLNLYMYAQARHARLLAVLQHMKQQKNPSNLW